MSAEYVEVEQARSMPGLRLVLSAGVPGPWGEAAKGIFRVKGVPCVRVPQEVGGPNPALQEWTGQNSAPVAVWNEERPRTTWIDTLFLAERIAPDPPLVPADVDERALVFGYSRELCGELGLGWCRRLMILHDILSNPAATQAQRSLAEELGAKYGYDPRVAQTAPRRVAAVLRALADRLARQRTTGSRFFVGDRLSALDIYWAAFAALIRPLPHDLCPMPDWYRTVYTNTDPAIGAEAVPLLMEHRDFVYHAYLELPITM